MENKNILMLA